MHHVMKCVRTQFILQFKSSPVYLVLQSSTRVQTRNQVRLKSESKTIISVTNRDQLIWVQAESKCYGKYSHRLGSRLMLTTWTTGLDRMRYLRTEEETGGGGMMWLEWLLFIYYCEYDWQAWSSSRTCIKCFIFVLHSQHWHKGRYNRHLHNYLLRWSGFSEGSIT